MFGKDDKKPKCCLGNSRVCGCKESLHHISRIEGQLRKLKELLEKGGECEKVAHMAASVSKSFDALRAKTLHNLVFNNILRKHKFSKKELTKIDEIFKYFKK